MTGRARATARPYAQALLELALERQPAAEVREALGAAVKTLDDNRELRAVLAHPALSGDKKKAIVAGVWSATAGAEGLVARLVALLAERHRIDALPLVEEAYGRLWNARRGVISAELTAATALEPAQLDALGEAVRRATGRAAEFKTRVDPRLLGGLVLTMDGKVYDGSVRARLKALRARLAQGGRVA